MDDKPTHELAKTKLLRQFEYEVPLMSCAIDPTGRWCFAGGRGRKIYVTNINTGKTTSRDDHESWVVSAARWGTTDVSVTAPTAELLESGKGESASKPSGEALVVTGDMVGRVVAWNTLAETPEPRWSIETGHGTLRAVAISSDGKLIATAGGDGNVRLWSAADGKAVRELTGHTCPIFSVAFHPDGKHLLTGDRGDQKIKQWEVATGKQLREFDANDLSNYRNGIDINYGGVRDIAFSEDGNIMLCCGRDGYSRPGLILQFDWRTGKQIRKQVSTFSGSIFHHVAFHPEGYYITSGVGAQTGEIWFWKPDEEEAVASIKVVGPAYGMNMHPDNRHVAVAQMAGPQTYGDKGIVGIYQMPTMS